ncbi:hypothetical protein D5278_09600 [bacterium 1XD21-13]|nr:hypothetical protein [bacterium 1XD21-13]
MKLLRLADRTISILSLLLFGALTGFSLFFTVYFSTSYEEIPYETGDIVPMVLAVCALGLFCMEWISRWILKGDDQEKRIRILLGLVLLYTLCFCGLWVKGAGCIPVGDQASVCTAAEGFRAGDYSMLTQDSYEKYLFIHPHQLGLTALIELIFACFGNGNFQAFEYLNCLGAVLCVYSGYCITRLLERDKRGRVYYLLLAACCFPLFFYVTFVYGEIPSLTYSLVAIWMYLEYLQKGKKRYLAGCCIACILACLIRNNSLILLIAFVGLLTVKGLGKRQWKAFGAAGLLIAVFLLSRLGLRSLYEERSGVCLNEGAPMILYVAMGMQKGEGAPGWSNGYILHAYWGASEFDGELATAMALEDIRSSVAGFRSAPLYALEFYREKFTSQWNDPTYECFAMTHINGWERCGIVNSMYVGKLHTLMTWFMNQYQSLVFIGVFLWLIFNYWREKPLENQVLLVTIFGGFLFHMLWEAKGRYILPYFVMMLPMAAAGLAELTARVNAWLILRDKRIKV